MNGDVPPHGNIKHISFLTSLPVNIKLRNIKGFEIEQQYISDKLKVLCN